MHCMLMDLLHGFEVLSTTEETLFNSHNASYSKVKQRSVQLRLLTSGCVFIMQISLMAFMHNCTTLRHQSVER